MEIFLILATIIGGIVGVIQIFKWIKPINLPIPRNKTKTISITLQANKNGSFDFNETEIKRISKELLFFLRNKEQIQIQYVIPQHNDARRKYKKLEKQKNLSQADIEQRNSLQKYFKSLDGKLAKLSRIIISVYSQADSVYATYGDESFSDILIGILDRFKKSSLVTGTKIDVWREKNKRFTTAIYLTDEELERTLSKLNLKSRQGLAFGPNNYFALELPLHIILKKLIPEVAFHLMWLSEREGNPIEQYSDNYNLLDWCIGLG
ncbi:hypothetical protein DGMP_22740 [Desulfomarina profundi]|uniref:Uncharacterized protein n=1 Tax=Desulfomarina profundi TaxID=2772557 RepID=A0A8D5JS06_9BACT|nr:hypothetical protein [Desulfomarina profundi]BCL61581.1 hypothetical protein DGMP_22740 [Desulfomarina profundi]